MSVAKLYFMCGKMGAGKSTAAAAMASELQAVLVSEDSWLNGLYPQQIKNFRDYQHYSALIKPLLQQHLAFVLRAGAPVVMDFPANTVEQREWFMGLAAEAGADHEMVYVVADDERCLAQIAKRRVEQPERAAFDTPETFHLVNPFFEEPSAAENIATRRIE